MRGAPLTVLALAERAGADDRSVMPGEGEAPAGECLRVGPGGCVTSAEMHFAHDLRSTPVRRQPAP